MNNGNFQNYDYGAKENIKRYGSALPSSYNVSDIKVPMFLVSAKNDWLVGPKVIYFRYIILVCSVETINVGIFY